MMKFLDIITLKAYRELRKEAQSAEEFAKERLELNQVYARLFNTEDGMFVLNHMVRTQLTGAIAMQGDTLLDIGEKQGRANHVKEIIQRLEIAKIS